MREIVEEFLREHLMLHVALIALSTTAILGSMAVDMATGIAKAKKRGVARTSKLLKKTADKATKYFLPFISLVFMDLICCMFIKVPVFSMIWAAYCVFCEFKSVREKSWQKEEIDKAERTARVIIENKDDIAKLVADMLFHREKTNTEKEES